jgi:hypothetical protein
LAHRPVSGICSSNAYIIKLLVSETMDSRNSSWCLESRRSITEVGNERGAGRRL